VFQKGKLADYFWNRNVLETLLMIELELFMWH